MPSMTGAPRQSDVCATPRPIGSSRFVFVLEQTLGQVAHTRNIERALAEEPSIDSTVIHLRYGEPEGLRGRLPGLRTWTFNASLQARSALRCRLREGPVDAAFIHTQVAAVLASRLMGSVPTIVSLDATPINFWSASSRPSMSAVSSTTIRPRRSRDPKVAISPPHRASLRKIRAGIDGEADKRCGCEEIAR